MDESERIFENGREYVFEIKKGDNTSFYYTGTVLKETPLFLKIRTRKGEEPIINKRIGLVRAFEPKDEVKP